jgi:hypothetical protein
MKDFKTYAAKKGLEDDSYVVVHDLQEIGRT